MSDALVRAPAGLEGLVADIGPRLTRPVDSLEVAATLESEGISDAVAERRYRSGDVFTLADAVLARLRAAGAFAPLQARPDTAPSSSADMIADYIRGPLSLLPVLVLLAIMDAYRELGRWTENQILAFSLGMTGSMLVTNCFIQALSRRGAIYLSREDRRSAAIFVANVMKVAAVSILAVAVLTIGAALVSRQFQIEDVVTFGLAFVALSAVWLTAGALALVKRYVWLGVGLAGGLAVGLAVDRVLSWSAPHLAVASAAGFAAALGIMTVAARRGFRPEGATVDVPLRLPKRAYLVDEAAPYFAYGLLYMVFVLLPHVIGWVGAIASSPQPFDDGSALEVGFTLALVPLMLVGGVAEHAARRFWEDARAAQIRTSGASPSAFGETLHAAYRRQAGRYVLATVVVSGAALGAFEVARRVALQSVFSASQLATAEFVFISGLVGYGFLGFAMFNFIFSISLGRPSFALRGLVFAIAATAFVGVPLAIGVDFASSGVAFVVGSLVLALWSMRETARLFRSADYYYYSSF